MEPWCCERVVPSQVAAVSYVSEILFEKREALTDENYLKAMRIVKSAHTLVTVDILRPVDDMVTPRAWRANRRHAMSCVHHLKEVVGEM